MKTRAKRQESRQSGGSPYLGELVKDSFMHIYIYTHIHTHTHTHRHILATLTHRGFFSCRHGLSCSMAHGILVPQTGDWTASSALEGRFLTTGPPGKSLRMTSLKRYYLSWGRKDISEQLCKQHLEKEREVWDPCPSSCSEYWVNHESWQCATASKKNP